MLRHRAVGVLAFLFLAAAAAAPAALGAQWSRDSTVSKMEDSRTYLISLKSTAEKSGLELVVHCVVGRPDRNPQPTVAFLSSDIVDGESSGGSTFADIRFRFDQASPGTENWWVNDASFRSIFTITQAKRTWQDSVAAAADFRVEIPIFRQGRTVFSFKPAGMQVELAWLRRQCGAAG